jgi:methylthioribose-1-phosphate isomerase
MHTADRPTRPIWFDVQDQQVKVIDQRRLPHETVITTLASVQDVIHAIREMYVRGAPLIGVTAAYGVYLATRETQTASDLVQACEQIKAARPTAVNLNWAVDYVLREVRAHAEAAQRTAMALRSAEAIAQREVENCRRIGEHGAEIIAAISRNRPGAPVNVLTHCNAGWLACVEYGTATAPIYRAFDQGIDLHVWVDETRPLNQGARLTAWELGQYGLRHTVITDNTGGHLMQHGMVDLVIVGTDRTTYTGDVANKIGTYLKALAANDNNVPFYVALPSSTFDWQIEDGCRQIPIEERDPEEVHSVEGWHEGRSCRVRLTPPKSHAANYAFDVTPARLVTGLITERGVCRASAEDIGRLFPDKLKP